MLSTTVRLTLPALHVWKWLTVENIRNVKKSNQNVIKCNQLHYFNKVIEKLHYLLHFKLGNL